MKRKADSQRFDKTISVEDMARMRAERMSLALSIVTSGGQCVERVLEKLHIWRAECLDAAAINRMRINTLIPLSAYLDLIDLLNAGGLSQPEDDELRARIQSWSL